MKKLIGVASLIIPTILLLAVVSVSLKELNEAPTIRLPITGYDPVHILHGRYLRFRFDQEHFGAKPKYRHNKLYSLCFVPQEKGISEASFIKTKEAGECAIKSDRINFFKASHKYFLDENYAKPLEDLLRKNRQILRARKMLKRQREEKPPSSYVRKYKDKKNLAPLPTIPVSMELAVSASGAMRFKMLYLDGEPWINYYSSQKQ